MTASAACPDLNLLSAYVERRVSRSERDALDAHFDGCRTCLSVVCDIVRMSPAGLAPSDVAEMTTEKGSVLGRYRVLEMIGQGGMGSVYAAYDPKLERKVALKVVRSDRTAQPKAHARLLREARTLAKLSHPNVVAIYDAGEVDDRVYVAMELVLGMNLDEWLRVEGRPVRAIIDVFLAAGRGLCAAHREGIVHRDFKPANVLIRRDGRVLVTDFGLAAAPAEDTATPGGTPRYMSPEQHTGAATDASSDQFSFAVAMFTAVYGEAPFEGSTVEQLRAAVLDGTVRSADRDASEEALALYPLLARALRREKSERWPDLEDLLARIEDRSPRASSSRVLRRSGVAALSAIVILVSWLGVVAWRERARGAPSDAGALPRVPVLPAAHGGRTQVLDLGVENHSGDGRLDGLVDAILGEIVGASTKLDVYAGSRLTSAFSDIEAPPKVVDEGAARALSTEQPNRVVVLRGTVVAASAGWSVTVRATDAATGIVVASREESARTIDELVPATIRIGRAIRRGVGDSDLADDRDGGRALSLSLDALHEWVVASRPAEPEEKVVHLHRALAIDPAFTSARMTLGLVLLGDNQSPEAATELETTLAEGERLSERRRLQALATYYEASGRYPESIAMFERILSRWPGDPSAEDEVTVAALNSQDRRLAVELARRSASAHPRNGHARAGLVIALMITSDFASAAREGEAMLSSLEAPPGRAFVHTAMAHILLGQPTEAGVALDRLRLRDEELADETRADIALYDGRLTDAEALLSKWIDHWTRENDAASARTEYLALADLRLRRGDRMGAAAAAKASLGGGSATIQYLAARTLLEAGEDGTASTLVRNWADSPAGEWRMYGKLLAADLLRAHGQLDEAVVAYREVARASDTWGVHERLGRTYLELHAWSDAERELSSCIARRGEAAAWATPTMRTIPPVLLALAQAREGLGKRDDAAAGYRTLLAGAGSAQHDSIAEQARLRLRVVEAGK